MKKLTLILILSAFSFTGFSQYNSELIDTTKMWSTLDYWSWMPSMHFTRYNKFSGDTLINQTGYTRVWEATDEGYSNWELKGFIREDTNSNIYLRTLYNQEGLIYKFNVNPGDNLSINNPFYVMCSTTVLDVDSVFLELSNEWRKRITLAPVDPYGNEEYWIEGIGSLAGILHSSYHSLPLTGAGYDLLCYWENESLIYTNPDYNFCYSSTVSISESSEDNSIISVYPSPLTSQSYVSLNSEDIKNGILEIRDIYGNLIKRTPIIPRNKILLERDQFKSGIYIITLFEGEKLIARKKFLVI